MHAVIIELIVQYCIIAGCYSLFVFLLVYICIYA